jgi:hypothetical protein
VIILIALIVGWLLWRVHQNKALALRARDRAAERKRLAEEMRRWYEAQIRLALAAQRKRTFEELRALP